MFVMFQRKFYFSINTSRSFDKAGLFRLIGFFYDFCQRTILDTSRNKYLFRSCQDSRAFYDRVNLVCRRSFYQVFYGKLQVYSINVKNRSVAMFCLDIKSFQYIIDKRFRIPEVLRIFLELFPNSSSEFIFQLNSNTRSVTGCCSQ